MGQELLLKIDVPVKSSAMGKHSVADSSSDQRGAEVKPFSSALDEQLEKQPVEQKKSPKPTSSESVDKTESVKKEDVPEEVSVTQDGKILPEQVSDEALVQLLAVGENDEASDDVEIDAAVVKIADDEVTKEVTLLDDALIKPQAQVIKTSVNTEGKEEVKPKFVAVAGGVNNVVLKTKEAIDTIKSAIVADDDGHIELKASNSEQKQQAPILRPDILNAIAKKTGGEGEKVKGDQAVIKTEKTMMAQILDKSFNDVKKMTKLLIDQKQESPLLKSVPERNFGGLVAALTPGATSSAATLAVQASSTAQPVLAMQPSMQTEAWGKVLSSRVIWMAREGVQQAELRLNPANLGPVEVKLHMSNDQANVTFLAQNAATRDALEQALPRLRESFQENGMDLASANVSDQETEQNNEEEKSENSSAVTKMVGDDLDTEDDSIESNEMELGVSVFA